MKKTFSISVVSIVICLSVCCKPKNTNAEQIAQPEPVNFTVINEIPALPVCQQISGTCWAFSTASFLESEIHRKKGEFINISAMYFVYHAYLRKAENYILRQGTARFTEGGSNYDPLARIEMSGLMPHGTYSGDTIRDHRNLLAELPPRVKDFADPGKKLGNAWRTEIPLILDEHMGRPATTFQYEGSEFTANDFLAYTDIDADDYINLTSFVHAPAYRYFILEIPANWNNTSYFNVPLDEYMKNIDHALDTGYSLAIDMDLIEPHNSGFPWIVNMPAGTVVTPEKRQADFESFATTDDHNMHLIGKVKDQHGNIYYKCKNSWGKDFGIDGCYYLSEAYVRAKSIYVMLHKDGLTENSRKRIEEIRTGAHARENI